MPVALRANPSIRDDSRKCCAGVIGDVVEFDRIYAKHEGYARLSVSIMLLLVRPIPINSSFQLAMFINAVVISLFVHDETMRYYRRVTNNTPLVDRFFTAHSQKWAEATVHYTVLLTIVITAVNAMMHKYRYEYPSTP